MNAFLTSCMKMCNTLNHHEGCALRIIDWLGYRFSNILFRLYALVPHRQTKDDTLRRILVISDDMIGDALVRMPLYAALRRCFPPCGESKWHITIAVLPNVASLFKNAPFFDEVIESPGVCGHCHSILWFLENGFSVSNMLKWARSHRVEILVNPVRVRSLGYDYMLRLMKPRLSVAYDTGIVSQQYPMTGAYQRRCYDRLYTHLVPARSGVPQADDLERLFHLVVGAAEERLVPCPAESFSAILKPMACKLPDNYIVLVPGANVPLRRWPADRFAKVADSLLANLPPDSAAVVVGVQAESFLGDEIVNHMNGRVVNLCGRTSLAELGTVLMHAALVVTNETGTATYSAILGAPTVCIVGGGDFQAFFPTDFYKNVKSVFRKEDCFFCRWKCTKPDLGNGAAPCILSVSVEDVVAAATPLL